MIVILYLDNGDSRLNRKLLHRRSDLVYGHSPFKMVTQWLPGNKTNGDVRRRRYVGHVC